jgi:arylsulfatase A-like enzyme
MPLVIQWRNQVKGGRVVDDIVNHVDFAPTFLEACGLPVPSTMTGRSLLRLLKTGGAGRVETNRTETVFGRERHTPGRPGRVGYPMRAIRTQSHLYIRNYAPDRWPAGDPDLFSDIDGGPTKTWLLAHREDAAVKPLYALCCGKRPAEELYDVRQDPFQMRNLAADPTALRVKEELGARLKARLRETADPREVGGEVSWDQYAYYGPPGFDLQSRPGYPQ